MILTMKWIDRSTWIESMNRSVFFWYRDSIKDTVLWNRWEYFIPWRLWSFFIVSIALYVSSPRRGGPCLLEKRTSKKDQISRVSGISHPSIVFLETPDLIISHQTSLLCTCNIYGAFRTILLQSTLSGGFLNEAWVVTEAFSRTYRPCHWKDARTWLQQPCG